MFVHSLLPGVQPIIFFIQIYHHAIKPNYSAISLLILPVSLLFQPSCWHNTLQFSPSFGCSESVGTCLCQLTDQKKTINTLWPHYSNRKILQQWCRIMDEDREKGLGNERIWKKRQGGGEEILRQIMKILHSLDLPMKIYILTPSDPSNRIDDKGHKFGHAFWLQVISYLSMTFHKLVLDLFKVNIRILVVY